MSQILSRFDFLGADFTLAVFVCLVLIWLLVLGCAISSVLSQPLSRKQRLKWIVAIVALPVLGLAVYIPFSFSNQSGAGLFALFSKHLVRKT